MLKSRFIQFDKKNNFILFFFVLLGLYISENGFAQKYWNREFVLVNLVTQTNCIVITIRVYDYPSGPKSKHGNLDSCIFEASVDKKNYLKLMEIYTPKQKRTAFTEIIFKNKLDRASIIFINDLNAKQVGLLWPDYLSIYLPIKIANYGYMSAVRLKWHLGSTFRDVRYIRVSGRWNIFRRHSEHFRNVVYDLYAPIQNAIISNIADVITKEMEKDTVTILKDSRAIAIRRAVLY